MKLDNVTLSVDNGAEVLVTATYGEMEVRAARQTSLVYDLPTPEAAPPVSEAWYTKIAMKVVRGVKAGWRKIRSRIK